MYVTRFKEDFGWDYQLMDVKTEDILEYIYDRLELHPNEPIDLEATLEEFYDTDKIYVYYEAIDEDIEFDSCIDEIAPEVITDFFKIYGTYFYRF